MISSNQQQLAENSNLSEKERLAWLRLIRTENVGPITFFRLMDKYGSANAAISAIPELSGKHRKGRPLRVPSQSSIEKEYETLLSFGGELITVADENYPVSLSALEDAPPVLSVIGRTELLKNRAIGMVGARNASYNGKKFAHTLAGDLGNSNFTIVSGLARGIDTAAHNGSIKTGTIAVIAGGINIVYPEENRGLYEQISKEGLIIAENAFGFNPRAQDFPRRNRIVSGISEGVIVIEATLRSGSLITARLAAEQGREVFAVPGSPLDPRAQGPNRLIRDGANLIEKASDVIDSLDSFNFKTIKNLKEKSFNGFSYNSQQELGFEEPELSPETTDILLENLSYDPIAVDELAYSCHLTIPVIQTLLLEMELSGQLQRHPGGRVSLTNR